MDYRVGDAVQVLWGVKWWPGRIVREVTGTSWEIRYDGWTESWNEVVGAERLLRAGETPPAPPPAPPKPPVVLDGPLAGADSVAWGDLEHTYGAASDIPECLSALRSTDVEARRRAVSHLGNALNHQGIGRGEATKPTVPFLLRLLDDPSVPDRAELANLLADFAVGDTWWFQFYGFHPTEQTRPDGCARPKASARGGGGGIKSRGFPDPGSAIDMQPGHGLLEIYEEVERAVPVALRALTSADAAVRASAAHLLAFLTRHGDVSGPALARAMVSDIDSAVRASSALALSHAGHFIAGEKRHSTSLLVEAWAGARTGLEKRAIALALARREDEAVMSLVRPWLIDDLTGGVPPLAPPWPFPWRRVDSAQLVFCAAFYGSSVEARPAVAVAAGRGLSKIVDEDDACDVAARLATICLGPPEPGVVPTFADADAETRLVLQAIGEAPLAWTYSDLGRRFDGYGLPSTREGFQAWIADESAPATIPSARTEVGAKRRPEKKAVAHATRRAAKKPVAIAKKKTAKKPVVTAKRKTAKKRVTRASASTKKLAKKRR